MGRKDTRVARRAQQHMRTRMPGACHSSVPQSHCCGHDQSKWLSLRYLCTWYKCQAQGSRDNKRHNLVHVNSHQLCHAGFGKARRAGQIRESACSSMSVRLTLAHGTLQSCRRGNRQLQPSCRQTTQSSMLAGIQELGCAQTPQTRVPVATTWPASAPSSPRLVQHSPCSRNPGIPPVLPQRDQHLHLNSQEVCLQCSRQHRQL